MTVGLYATLDAQMTAKIAAGKQDLLPVNRRTLDIPRLDLYSYSIPEKRRWLHHIKAARKAYDNSLYFTPTYSREAIFLEA